MESNTLSFNGNAVDQQKSIARLGQAGDEVEVCIAVVGTFILDEDRGGSYPCSPAAFTSSWQVATNSLTSFFFPTHFPRIRESSYKLFVGMKLTKNWVTRAIPAGSVTRPGDGRRPIVVVWRAGTTRRR